MHGSIHGARAVLAFTFLCGVSCGGDGSTRPIDGGSLDGGLDAGTGDGGVLYPYDDCARGRCVDIVFGDGFENYCSCVEMCDADADCMAFGGGRPVECAELGSDRFCVLPCVDDSDCPSGLACEDFPFVGLICGVPL